jgi:hypothetical protein
MVERDGTKPDNTWVDANEKDYDASPQVGTCTCLNAVTRLAISCTNQTPP